jgi:sugar lactone lactonase YvrE
MSKATSIDEQPAEIVREYGPFPGVPHVHGVTYDGSNVWIAGGDSLQAFEPAGGQRVRVLEVPCDAGTAFDGRHLYQIADDRIQKIDPGTGQVVATIPAPGRGLDSGLTWAEGTLWVGQLWHGTWEDDESEIRHVDPENGEVLDHLTMPAGTMVSGLEADGGELFYAGGGSSGKVRAVRRPRRKRRSA